MTLPKKLGYILMAAAATVSIAATPASAQATTRGATTTGPYCPARAIPMGIWSFSYVGANGHHYDVYHGLPFSPFGYGTVDCDH